MATTAQAAATPSHSNSPAPSDEFEYADTSTMACLLCARQFKTFDQLKRHNKESDLHKVHPTAHIVYKQVLTLVLDTVRKISKMQISEKSPGRRHLLDSSQKRRSSLNIETGHSSVERCSTSPMFHYQSRVLLGLRKWRRNASKVHHRHRPHRLLLFILGRMKRTLGISS